MHGRKKSSIALTQEELEQQRNDLEKASVFLTKILTLRDQKVYTEATYEMTRKALELNPEFNTLWNYRREIMLELGTDLYQQELSFLESALAKAPKAYCIWFHRKWVLKKLPEMLHKDLALCEKMFQLDERNFHCWNHYQWLMDQIQMESSECARRSEVMSRTLIDKNFSNYSAWHLRTRLPRGDQREELDWVKGGIFTEPQDQSVWQYYEWFLQAVAVKREVRVSHVCKDIDGLAVFFTRPVEILAGEVRCDDLVMEGHWEALASDLASPGGFTSSAWLFRGTVADRVVLDLSLPGEKLQFEGEVRTVGATADPQAALGLLPPTNRKVVEEELQSITELVEMEPDCKLALRAEARYWALLHSESTGFLEAIASRYARLTEVDPCKKAYYADCLSNAVVANLLADFLTRSSLELSLRSQRLTALPANLSNSIFGISVLDVSQNSLTSVRPLLGLRSLVELRAGGNQLRHPAVLQQLARLPQLRKLDLSDNGIGQLEPTGETTLETVILTGNEMLKVYLNQRQTADPAFVLVPSSSVIL